MKNRTKYASKTAIWHSGGRDDGLGLTGPWQFGNS